MSEDLAGLLRAAPYGMPEAEKTAVLLPLIKEQVRRARSNEHLNRFFRRQKVELDRIASLEDLPPLPVQMFKHFDLATCPAESIVKTIRSSGTTSSRPSRIPLDKPTMMNQTRALSSILSDYLGRRRKVFLVIDHEGMNRSADDFTARTAGIRGLSLFAKQTLYLLKEGKQGLELDLAALDRLDRLRDADVYAFGFTFIVWTEFLPRLAETGRTFRFADFKLFHSGGWKKLAQRSVSKQRFSTEVARVFSASAGDVHDFYGMAEQTGIIFVDCPEGHKHVPVFSQVIVRDVDSLRPCGPGEPGMIEIMSVLGSSYFSQALLTEDIGTIVGVDDCPCGRKGRYFRFKQRIEQAELRGCGDTFRAS